MLKLKKSIFGKTVLLMVLLSIIAGGFVLIIALREQTISLEKNLVEENIVLVKIAAQSIQAGYLSGQWPFETLKQITDFENVLFLWVVSPDGEIYLADDPEMWGKIIRDEALNTKQTIVKESVFYKTGEKIKLIVHPVFYGKRGSLFLGVSLRPITAARNKIIFTSIAFFAIVIIFATLLSFYFARRLTNPIVTLTNGVESIAAGELGHRVALRTGDEIEELADTFNQMAGKLQKQIEELKELDRMKSEFLSITSHELKTPMTPIKAQLQLLLEKYFGRLNKKQEHSLKMILRNAKRLDILISDILEVSRIGSKKMKLDLKSEQLNNIVLGTIENMESLINKKQLKVKTKLAKLPKVMVDKERIGQVLTNLLNNAIKFTPNRGGIVVETVKKSGNVIVKVSDTGIGIAKENLKKIFEPFVQLEPSATRKYGGTGLGLSISKGIVELHNGSIWAESVLGKGSDFYFTLPINRKNLNKKEKI